MCLIPNNEKHLASTCKTNISVRRTAKNNVQPNKLSYNHKDIIKCFREPFKRRMFSCYAVKDGKASPKTTNLILSPGTRKNLQLFKVCSLAILTINLISNSS